MMFPNKIYLFKLLHNLYISFKISIVLYLQKISKIHIKYFVVGIEAIIMRTTLKSIDFYHAVPSELSQGTISGACISVTAIITLIVLSYGAISNYHRPIRHSDLIVDQKHLDQKLQVNIDIEFPRYPCSMLSLDIQNVLRVHQVNIGGGIQKYKSNGQLFIESSDRAQQKRRILDDLRNGQGCNIKGVFQIDRVPGNFHFSCHGYGSVVQQILNDGSFRQLHKKIDLSHKINYLFFGEDHRQIMKPHDSLKDFESKKQIGQDYLGISYLYFLDIIQRSFYSQIQPINPPTYQYTVRMNEVILASAPTVVFRYENNPISFLTTVQNRQFHILFVRLIGIIGGIFTVATIIDGLVHSSIRFLVEKQRLGKLK